MSILALLANETTMRAMQARLKISPTPSAIAELDAYRYARWTQRRCRFLLAAGIRADLEHIETDRWVAYFMAGVTPEEAAMEELWKVG